MYKAFYNLQRNPFDLTPDPSFLFPTARHNEALATLYHGVRGHKGFVVLTGEVGTGKTLLLRCLLQLLKQSEDVAYAYIFNSCLAPIEFLQYVARDFGLQASGRNKGEVLFDLSNFVIERATRKLTTVLIVDEAHHLSADILEEIRLLTNLETTQEKLLQVMLVGQPELNDKLDSATLRQLKQRIAHRSHLAPLDQNETGGYIERRLQLAGGSPSDCPIFQPLAVEAVYRHSRGIPRLINTICENALITAYARQKPNVTSEMVEEVAADLHLNLNVVRLPREKNLAGDDETDVRRAAKNLLDLYAYLNRVRSSDEEARVPVSIQGSHT